MTQSEGLGTCPICLSSMDPDGDHKLCTLKCGHLFGYLCIIQWLENKNICPICRQKAKVKDIIPLIWDHQLNSDELVTQLNQEKDQLLQKQQTLAEELKMIKGELNSTKDELSQALQFSSQLSNQNNRNKNNLTRSIAPASIIYERNMNDSFRLLVFNNQLFVSEKTGSKFGLQISSLNNLNNKYFLSIHDGQIRDISNSPDLSTVATVSIDKSMCLVNSRTSQIISRFSTSEPLWSCCWASRYLLASGGNCGKLFIRDIRTGNSSITSNAPNSIIYNEDSVFQMAPGPPLFTVLPLSTNRILCISPIIGRYFDLRNGKFEPNSNNIEGGQLACSLHNYDPNTLSSSSNNSFSYNMSFSQSSNIIMVTFKVQPHSAKSIYYSMKSDCHLQNISTR